VAAAGRIVRHRLRIPADVFFVIIDAGFAIHALTIATAIRLGSGARTFRKLMAH
jgi:hypothetical protein